MNIPLLKESQSIFTQNFQHNPPTFPSCFVLVLKRLKKKKKREREKWYLHIKKKCGSTTARPMVYSVLRQKSMSFNNLKFKQKWKDRKRRHPVLSYSGNVKFGVKYPYRSCSVNTFYFIITETILMLKRAVQNINCMKLLCALSRFDHTALFKVCHSQTVPPLEWWRQSQKWCS